MLLCCQDERWILKACCHFRDLKQLPCKRISPHHLWRGALTNGPKANGREGANQEDLDLFSVSHSVCVLFSGFSWGQLWYKQMDFKVVGLNKSLHDILMIQVFWDCKARLEISEGIYFCFLGQAEIQEIDVVPFFCWFLFLFFSTLWLWDAFAHLIRENNLLLTAVVTQCFFNFW